MSDVTGQSDPSELDQTVDQDSSVSGISDVPYRDYSEVPWYRKSSSNTLLILLSFLTFGFVPGVLIVCIIVLTGDVYLDRRDKDGNLERWSWGNKVVAVILLFFNIMYLAAAMGQG